ncbi:MAG: TetR/AcrR family transcriptional regulator [Armatimonadetes bacterium]|nr:TetR/AcrR family transcriptional regulator [Armatimonadota bacterium]
MNREIYGAHPRLRLRRALIQTATEVRFDAITVQQVLDRADVSRGTFYAHYRNLDDLFLGCLQDLTDYLLGEWRKALLRRITHHGELGFMRPMLAHVISHRWLWDALRGTRAEAILLERLDWLLRRWVSQDMRRLGRPVHGVELATLVGGLKSLVVFAGIGPEPVELSDAVRVVQGLARQFGGPWMPAVPK